MGVMGFIWGRCWVEIGCVCARATALDPSIWSLIEAKYKPNMISKVGMLEFRMLLHSEILQNLDLGELRLTWKFKNNGFRTMILEKPFEKWQIKRVGELDLLFLLVLWKSVKIFLL
jgi:hypothetical protein